MVPSIEPILTDTRPDAVHPPHTPIQILPAAVVERIAAGEVIERPVSVVRELVDNSLDSGASELRVDIRGGGLRLIRVTDNGQGIPPAEVELAVRHHATSKLRSADELFEIASLGFRGEALPSIAAVAELSIHTASPGAQVGVNLEVRSGEIVGRTYLARSIGTTVTVRNLFATVPARLKFIGNARAESSQISQLIRRYALAHPEVRFTLTLDGHLSLRTSGAGLDLAVLEVFGSVVGSALLPLGPWEHQGIRLSGLVSGAQVTRSARHHVTLLVNRRCVQSRSLLAAFEEGYRPLLARGRHPLAVISLELPRNQVDVNVHPSKAEVKLHHEAAICAGLKDSVRLALGRNLSVPAPHLQFALGATQFELPRLVAERGPEWEVATHDRLREARVKGQVHGSLIVLEDASGLYLVDQHRAHERAIYELLRRRHVEGRAGQLLLEPLHIELSRRQIALLEPRMAELARLGFICEWFGGRSFLVRSVPVIPETADLSTVVEDLVELATDDESDWQHRLLTSVACRSATRRGRALTVEQCRELVELLADTETPAVCPHGAPIILHFSEQFFERQFNW